MLTNDLIAKARAWARKLEADGELWLVYEFAPTYDRRGPSLVFESASRVRRVRDYPQKWRDLPDGELTLLKEQT